MDFPQCFEYTQSLETYFVDTVCEVDVFQVGGKTRGTCNSTKDKVYTSLVQCEGLGNCRKRVHSCCTVSPRACAHAYCCRQKLHDVILGLR